MMRLVFTLFLAAATALCADLTGTWQLSMGAAGVRGQYTLVLKQDGANLTGSLTADGNEMPIRDGKVNGDRISFVVARSWGGRETAITYTGRMSGDEIRFKVAMPGAERTWDVPAKRAQ